MPLLSYQLTADKTESHAHKHIEALVKHPHWGGLGGSHTRPGDVHVAGAGLRFAPCCLQSQEDVQMSVDQTRCSSGWQMAPRLSRSTDCLREPLVSSDPIERHRWGVNCPDQFGPDQVPVFLAQVPAPNRMPRGGLHAPRLGGIHVTPTREALIEVLLIDTGHRGEPLSLLCGNDVHALSLAYRSELSSDALETVSSFLLESRA